MHCSVAIFDQKLEIFINLWHIVLEKLDFIYFFSATKRVVELPLKSSAHIAIESTTIKKESTRDFFSDDFCLLFFSTTYGKVFYFTLTRFFCGLHPWKTNSLHLWATIKTIKKKLLTFLPSLFLYLLKMKRIVWKIDFQMIEDFSFFSWFFFILKLLFFRVIQVRKEQEK